MKKILIFLTLLLLIIISSWPLFNQQFFRVHDYVHAARIVEMASGLQEGQLPVRWSGNFGYGYGMPLFQFYAPLPFFVGAILFLIGLPVVSSIKGILLISAVVTAVGMYKLAASLFGRWSGLLGATALLFAPYRAVNLYVRGAFSEIWGIMTFPWLLYSLVLFSLDQKSSGLAISFWTAVLLLSHNLMALIFLPLSFVFGLAYLWYQFIFKQKTSWLLYGLKITQVAAYYLLGAGLAAFYFLPAVIEKGYTKIDSILGGYFDYSLHFLYIRQFFQPTWGYGGSVWGPEDDISFFMGYGQLLAVLVATVLMVLFVYTKIKQGSARKFFQTISLSTLVYGIAAFLLGTSLFFTLLRSKPIWDVVPVFEFIQFPWRWLGAAIVFMALLVSTIPSLIKSSLPRSVVSVVLILITVITAFSFFQPQSYLDTNDDYYYTDETRIRTQMSGILPDFIPLSLSSELSPNLAADQEIGSVMYCQEKTCPSGEVLLNRAHEKLLSIDLASEQSLEFAIADYPGWQVEVDGQVLPAQTSDRGLLSATLPAGRHNVGLLLTETPVRAFANSVSVVSMIVCLYLLWPFKKSN